MKLRIRYYRIRKGWKQEDLARQSGITEAQVSRIESHKVNPHVTTLKKIADALGVTIDELIEEESRDLQKVG